MSVAKFSCVNFPLVFFCYSISFFFSWRGNCFHSFHDFPNFFSFLLSHLPTIFIFRFSLIFPLLFVFEVRKLLRENQIIVMNSLSNRQLLSPLCSSPLKTDPPWMKTSFHFWAVTQLHMCWSFPICMRNEMIFSCSCNFIQMSYWSPGYKWKHEDITILLALLADERESIGCSATL